MNRIVLTFIALLTLTQTVWADVTITPQMIEARVRQYVLQNTALNEPDTTLSVEMVRLPFEPLVLKGDHVEYTFSDSRPDAMTFRTIVQVTMSTEGETRQLGVPVHIMLEKPVWVATHLIRAGAQVTAADAMIQRKRLDYDVAYALGENDTITGYTSHANISPGTILDTRKLSATPVVLHDEDVHMILAMDNGLQISVMAHAMQDGAIGQQIRVSRTLEDARIKTYTAQVVGKNLVLVKM